jgi:hypothetical protein
MSDQAIEQSPQELSIEDRFATLLAEPVPEEEEVAESEEQPAPQDNEEEVETTEEEGTPEEEQAETEEETAELDLVEVEVAGKKIQVPEELVEYSKSLQADYTRKTTEVAEQRKQVEQMQMQLQQQAQIQQESLAEYAQLTALDNQIQAFNQVDWNALYDSDPAEFVKLKEARRDLLDNRQALANTIGTKQQQLAAQQRETYIKAVEEGQKVLAREIPNWNNELARNLNTLAVDKYGFTPEEVAQVIDPRVVKLLHDAYRFQKQQSNRPVAEKKVANLPKVSKPGSPSAAKSVATSREAEARKALKKTGSVDASQAVFLARYSK